MKTRRLIIAAVSIVAVLGIIVGVWYLARTVQSPAQRDAAAAAPSMGPIAVPAERGNLVDQITAAGHLSTEQTTTIAIPLADGSSVVTENPVSVGDTLRPGDPVLRINGRPLIALTGSFPAYRDLAEGAEGDDVRQLQQALSELGYSLAIDGEFGPATTRAITQLYRANGVEPLTVSQGATTRTDRASEDHVEGTSDKKNTSANNNSTHKTGAATITVPRNEIVFVPHLDQNSTITALPAVGTTLTDITATISLISGSPKIQVEAPQSTAESLQLGTTATASIAGEQYTFVLEKVVTPDESTQNSSGDLSSTDTSASSGTQSAPNAGVGGAAPLNSTYTLIFNSERPLPADLTHNDSILLYIDRTAPITDAILIPKRAVASSPDGQHTVLRKDQSGNFTAVDVELLACVGGQCAVSEDSLSVGDLLRVDGS